MMDFVSVIVITKNNAYTIEECIHSLLNQTYSKDKYEVIFVDGYSDDGTDKVIKTYAKQNPVIKLYYENVGTMGYARNIGISKCRGDIIAFTDGDAIPPENWIEHISISFNDDNLMILGGLDVLVSSAVTSKIIDSWRRKKKVHGIKAIPCIKTVNFAIRRRVLLSSTGFDPTLNHWDEAELMARLYFKKGISQIVYDPDLSVVHKTTKSPSLRRRIKKTFNKSIKGTSTLMRRHMLKVAFSSPTSTIGISVILAISVIAGIAGFLLSFFLGWLVPFVLSLSIIYTAGLIGYMIIMFQQTNKFLISALFILTLDLFVRYFGTFFGVARWLKNLVIQKNPKNPLNTTKTCS